jgi:rhodanese-related sulfurtransferase
MGEYRMFRSIFGLALTTVLFAVPYAAYADSADTVAGEKKVFAEYRSVIAKDKVKSVDDLYKKSQEVSAGTTKAVIVEFRSSQAEFDSGHVPGAEVMLKPHIVALKWPDPETELWVFARTRHTATYFAALLSKYGYKNVHLVDGGLADWVRKGYPLTNKVLGDVRITKASDYVMK